MASNGSLSLLYGVHRVAYLTGRLVDEAVEETGLNSIEFAVYSFLIAQGPAPISEVAGGIALPIATTSKLLTRVDERGHLTRTPNPADGRSTLVGLNDAGRAAHAEARPGFGKALRRVEDELGAAFEEVSWALERLDAALSTALDEPGEAPPTARKGQRTLSYGGTPLTGDEEQQVRRFIAFVQSEAS